MTIDNSFRNNVMKRRIAGSLLTKQKGDLEQAKAIIIIETISLNFITVETYFDRKLNVTI